MKDQQLRNLVALLQDPDPRVRVLAAKSLAVVGDGDAIPHLLLASCDTDIRVAMEASRAISAIIAREWHRLPHSD